LLVVELEVLGVVVVELEAIYQEHRLCLLGLLIHLLLVLVALLLLVTAHKEITDPTLRHFH
jgi:hypothetical protein